MGINEQLDLGLFGPQSVVWKFHSSKVALVGGIRALMIQALEPRAMAAVEKAGGYKVDPAGRLARTIEFIQTVSFAPTKEAMAAISKVISIHSRINGVDPITGMTYDASDPLQLAYVHNAFVESIAIVHELYDPYTSISEIDSYILEMSSLARLLGVRDFDLPQQYQSLKRWVDSFDPLISTDAAREAVGYLKSPLMPFPMDILWKVAHKGAILSLSEKQSEMLDLRLTAREKSITPCLVRSVMLSAQFLLPSAPIVQLAKDRAHLQWRLEHQR